MTGLCPVCGWLISGRQLADMPWCVTCWGHLLRGRATAQQAARMLDVYWSTWQQIQERRRVIHDPSSVTV